MDIDVARAEAQENLRRASETFKFAQGRHLHATHQRDVISGDADANAAKAEELRASLAEKEAEAARMAAAAQSEVDEAAVELQAARLLLADAVAAATALGEDTNQGPTGAAAGSAFDATVITTES